MKNFNKIEKTISEILSSIPILKKTAKQLYRIINFYLSKKRYQYKIFVPGLLNEISINKEESFFGYYDRKPINNGRIIYHSIPETAGHPQKCENIRIMLDNQQISETNTWNYQQGSMLSWLNNDEIIHNFFADNNFKSKIININSGKIRNIDFPVYSVILNKDFAISLNFSRLAKYRSEYGYFNKEFKETNFNEDGVFYVDLSRNEQKLIISFEELINFKFTSSMNTKKYKINHILLSPEADKFIFYHRWFDKNGIKHTRLFVYNLISHSLKLLNDYNMTSHCVWIDNDKIAGWMNNQDLIAGFYIVDTNSGNFTLINGLTNSDGHPDIFENRIIVDTYPDKASYSHLFLYDIDNKKNIEIGEFLSPLRYHDFNRCDLHPRIWENTIFFDSTHSGKRHLYKIDLSGKS